MVHMDTCFTHTWVLRGSVHAHYSLAREFQVPMGAYMYLGECGSQKLVRHDLRHHNSTY